MSKEIFTIFSADNCVFLHYNVLRTKYAGQVNTSTFCNGKLTLLTILALMSSGTANENRENNSLCVIVFDVLLKLRANIEKNVKQAAGRTTGLTVELLQFRLSNIKLRTLCNVDS